MNTEDKFNLWTHVTLSRYFLIPEDQELEIGDFTICTLQGNKKDVNFTAITRFEITESEAKNHLQAEMNQALEAAKNAVSNFMAFSTQKSQATPSNPSSSADDTQSTQNLISTLLGITPEELQNNPEAAQTALVNVYTEFKELLGVLMSKNPADVEAARSRLHSLRENLSTQGINISEELEELPKKLQEVLAASTLEEYLKEIVTKLRDFADQIDQSPDAVGQTIDETVHRLSQDLFIDEEKHLEEQRKQQYRQSAQDAIAQSLRNRGIPSFAGGELQSEPSQQHEDI